MNTTRIGGTDHVDVLVDSRSNPGSTIAFLHQRTHLDPRAFLAQSLASAMMSTADVALYPGYVATKACDTAEALFKEFETRGWLIKMPSFKELEFIGQQGEDIPDGTN
jgi:hypothetical protein